MAPHHLDDFTLVQGVLSGGDDDLRHLGERLRVVPRLVAACNARLGGPLSATELPDLVQDVIVLLWRKLAEYRGDASLETWVYRIGSLELYNHLRRKRRGGVQGGEELALVREDPSTPLEDWMLSEELQGALGRLPEGGQEVLRLKHYEDLTFREIGERMKFSTSQAKAQYYDAIERLRRLLGSSHGEERT